jgi:hypothetical protein
VTSLFTDVRQQAIEALCDTDGMKWSDATDLVDKLIEAAPLRGDELIRAATLSSRHVVELERVLDQLLVWFLNEVAAGDEQLQKWVDLIGSVVYPESVSG